MAIFVTGDTHGGESRRRDGYMGRFNTEHFPVQKELTKDDFVVICGDFGGVWRMDRVSAGECPQEKYELDWLDKKPFTTLFVPGNHENYDRLTGASDELLNSWLYEKMPEEEKEILRRGYPREAWHGGYVRRIRDSVMMLEPGIFEIDGKRCFVYGGAASYDIHDGVIDPLRFASEDDYKRAIFIARIQNKEFRERGISWWKRELPDERTEYEARKALNAANNNVDFVFTHDCCSELRAFLGYTDDLTQLNSFLQEVHELVTYKHWYFGHLHDNRDFPGGFDHLIYDYIVQIA